MENFDTIQPADKVEVTIIGPEDNQLYQAISSGFTKASEAVEEAVKNAVLVVKPELCVFVVKNMATGQMREYRYNAHGNLHEII